MKRRRSGARPARVLIVDDNPGDALLVQEAMSEASTGVDCQVVADGREALDVLQAAGDSQGLPDLLIVDLNMPRVNGLEVLRAIRAREEWRHLPVVIMTSSNAKADVLAAYRNHANSYIEKPSTSAEFFDVVHGLERYWLELAELPNS